MCFRSGANVMPEPLRFLIAEIFHHQNVTQPVPQYKSGTSDATAVASDRRGCLVVKPRKLTVADRSAGHGEDLCVERGIGPSSGRLFLFGALQQPRDVPAGSTNVVVPGHGAFAEAVKDNIHALATRELNSFRREVSIRVGARLESAAVFPFLMPGMLLDVVP